MFAKYFLLSFPVTSFGLGIWQLKRLEWKKGLIEKLEERFLEEPLSLSQIISLEDLTPLEYRRVKIRGRFDQNVDRQILLRPKQLVVNREAILRGRTEHQSNNGVNIITAFNVDDTNIRVLINRGWLALRGKDSIENSRDVGLGPKNESIDIIGILRTSDKRPTFGMKSNATINELHLRDVETMSKMLNTAPIYLDADTSLSPDRGPIGGQTALNVRNEHLNYAITWFGLSAFAFIMWYSKYGRARPMRKLLGR